ncbi:MAG: preprotein translocase subunit SecG [Chthoniobacterales bacterium]
MTILLNLLLALFVLVALLMVLVILMQRPKSEGLGAAFGGGVTENIFGAQTTNVLTKITGWLAGIFFLLTFALSILYAHKGNAQSGLRRELMKTEPSAPNSSAPAQGTAAALLKPAPSSAVGAPGTVTNPTPATSGPAPSARPADLAVGAVPAGSASAAPASPAQVPVVNSPGPAASPVATP